MKMVLNTSLNSSVSLRSNLIPVHQYLTFHEEMVKLGSVIEFDDTLLKENTVFAKGENLLLKSCFSKV